MMRILHPTYQMRVTIKDTLKSGQDAVQASTLVQGASTYKPHEFWDGIAGKTGCDEVLAKVNAALKAAGLNAEVSFEQFSHT